MKKKRQLTDRSDDAMSVALETNAKAIANEIDAEVLRSMLDKLGWREVILAPMTFEQGDSIDCWMHDNVKGRYWTHGLVWMFEHDKDAMWFKLKWLS